MKKIIKELSFEEGLSVFRVQLFWDLIGNEVEDESASLLFVSEEEIVVIDEVTFTSFVGLGLENPGE